MNINNIGDDKKELVMVHAWNVVTDWCLKWEMSEHMWSMHTRTVERKWFFQLKKNIVSFVIIPF